MENISNEELTERIAEYSQPFINLLPIVGGAFASTIQLALQRRQNRRLEKFLNELVENIRRMEDSMLNTETLQTEQFRDFFEQLISCASDTWRAEKLEAFKRLFLNSLVADNFNYDETAEILGLINKYQPRHIILLKVLANPAHANPDEFVHLARMGSVSTKPIDVISKLLLNWDKDCIVRTLRDLDRDGLQTIAEPNAAGFSMQQLKNALTVYGRRVPSVPIIVRQEIL